MLNSLIVFSMCFSYSSSVQNLDESSLCTALYKMIRISNDLNFEISNDFFVYDINGFNNDSNQEFLCAFEDGKYFVFNDSGDILSFNYNEHVFNKLYDGSLYMNNGKLCNIYGSDFFNTFCEDNDDLPLVYNFSDIGSNSYEINILNDNLLEDNSNILYCENSYFFENFDYDCFLSNVENLNYSYETKKAITAFAGILSYYILKYGNDLMPTVFNSRTDLLGDIVLSKGIGTNYTSWISPYISQFSSYLLGSDGICANEYFFMNDYSKLVESQGIIYLLEQNLSMTFEVNNSATNSCGLFYSYEDGMGYCIDSEFFSLGYEDRNNIFSNISYEIYFDKFLVDYVDNMLVGEGRPLLVNSLNTFGIAYGEYITEEGYIYLITNVVDGENNECILVNLDLDLEIGNSHIDDYHLELLSFTPNLFQIINLDFIPTYMSINSYNNYNLYNQCITSTFSTINTNNHYRYINGLSYLEEHYFIFYPAYKKCSCCGLKVYNSGIEDNPSI